MSWLGIWRIISMVACLGSQMTCCVPCAVQIQPLTPLVDEFAGRLFGELDYIQEGLNAERFQVCLCPAYALARAIPARPHSQAQLACRAVPPCRSAQRGA